MASFESLSISIAEQPQFRFDFQTMSCNRHEPNQKPPFTSGEDRLVAYLA